MNIEELWEKYKSIGINALVMNHYDLAEQFTGTTADQWKMFLMAEEVKEWIKQEVTMIQDSELKKLVKDISSSRSVGQAQVMNTLSKLNETKEIKEGPMFIYTYVPLNENEQGDPNTAAEDKDVFTSGT